MSMWPVAFTGVFKIIWDQSFAAQLCLKMSLAWEDRCLTDFCGHGSIAWNNDSYTLTSNSPPSIDGYGVRECTTTLL